MTGAPEELRRTVAKVISEGVRDAQYADDVADAVLAVPAIADALRDAALLAQVREIVTDNPRQPAYAGCRIAQLLREEA